MSITIVLIGGPADGRTFMIGADQLPMLWRVPIEQPIAVLLADPADYTPTPVADYEPMHERGWPSRTDDGAYRYRYRGTTKPIHPPQTRRPYTLDELAAMPRDPAPSAYPDSQAHLLACRTRHSLRRDARPSPQERETLDAVTLADIHQALAERRHGGRGESPGNRS